MKYFTIEELSNSATAKKRGIDNAPDAEARANLTALVHQVLDPLREALGKPITVTSGYRSPLLNAAVGGVKSSHHCKGCAADITAGSQSENAKMLRLAVELELPYCQLIWEKGSDAGPQWVHISYVKTDIRRQLLRTKDGKTYYSCDKTGKKR